MMNINVLQQMMQNQAMSTLTSEDDLSSYHSQMLDLSFKQLLLEKINSVTAQQINLNTGEQPTFTPINNNSTRTTGLKSSTIPTTQFNTYITDTAQKYGIDEKLIHSVIKTESNYNQHAKSGAGAQGLMQLMPTTARGLGVSNAYDAKQNIEGGTKYLSQMLKRYNGNVELALAAYNAGPGNVDKHQGIPPFNETKNYVKKVTNLYFA